MKFMERLGTTNLPRMSKYQRLGIKEPRSKSNKCESTTRDTSSAHETKDDAIALKLRSHAQTKSLTVMLAQISQRLHYYIIARPKRLSPRQFSLDPTVIININTCSDHHRRFVQGS
jgi:hypothetical protein